jgi:WD40 repeat protein
MSSALLHVDREHPWPALAAFREGDQSFFGGRDEEIEAIYRRIVSSRLTLLFGLSGLGKTSLLRAGLFPRLRREHYFPVYIRLSYGRDLASPVEQIKAEIAAQAKVSGVEAPAPRGGETLWEYFHRPDADFWDERNNPCIPVLVFDQFEELFTKSREVPVQANEVVEELANLAEGASPELMREASAGDRSLLRQVWEDRYRMLFGIRADYLAQLQTISDRMRAIFANRYELRRMSGAAALRSTLTAGGHLMDEEVARRVVRFLAGAPETAGALPSVDGLEVEPALLSLVCSELNATRLERREAKITTSMLSGTKDEILSRFYEASFADVTPQLRELVEDKLVTRDGRARNFISEETARETPGVTEEDLGKLVHRRLLRFEESGSSRRLELTHDLLTAVAAASRATREQRRQIEEAEKARLEAERVTEAARKTVRRTRAAALLFFVLLAAAIVGPFIASRRATIGAKRIEAESAFHLALQKLGSEEPSEGLAYLAHVVRNDPHNDAARILLYEMFITRSWPVPLRKFGPEERFDAAEFSGDGAFVAFRIGETIEAWDVARGERIASLGPRFRPESIRFAGDNQTLVLAGSSQNTDDPKQVLLWNIATNRKVTLGDIWALLGSSVMQVGAADVSADGKDLAVASDRVVSVVPLAGGPVETFEVRFEAKRVRFSPDSRFVTADLGPLQAILDRQTKVQHEVDALKLTEFAIAYSPDGRKLLVGNVKDVAIVNVEDGKPDGVRLDHPSPAIQGAFDPSGQRIVTVAEDYGVRVWDAVNGTTLYDPLWHYEPVREALFTSGGARVLTRSARLVRWWDASSGKGLGAPIVVPKSLAAQAIDSGRNVAVVSDALRVWTAPVAVLPPAALDMHGAQFELSPDRRTVVARQADPLRLVAFDTETGRQLWTAEGGHPLGTPAAHPESPMNAYGVMIDARSGRSLPGNPMPGMIAEDASTMVYPAGKAFIVSSTTTGKPIGPPIEASDPNVRVCLSRGGARLAVGDPGRVRVWDVRGHRVLLEVRDEESPSIDLSADGQRLVTVSPQRGLRIWNVSGGAAATIQREGTETWARFAPDGRGLVVMSDDDVALCDAESLRCRPETLAHANVDTVAFSADGARLMTASDHDLRVWDTGTGRPLTPALPLGEAQPSGLTRDGGAVLGVADRLYRVPLPQKVSDDDARRLADLAEAISGLRVARLGLTERIAGRPKLDELSQRCGKTPGLACDVVRWMRAPQEQRTISPASKVTIGDYVRLTTGQYTEEHLRALFP